jgi:hypothetical protein
MDYHQIPIFFPTAADSFPSFTKEISMPIQLRQRAYRRSGTVDAVELSIQLANTSLT